MATSSNRSDDDAQRRGWGTRLWHWLKAGARGEEPPPGRRRDDRSRQHRKPSSPVRQASMERGHEPENATERVGGILVATALLVGSVAAVVVVLYAFVGFLGERNAAAPLAEAEITSAEAPRYQAPPKPRLQIDPAIDLQELHQAEYERLHAFGRVDSTRLHIPIERAMRLVAQRGLPADSASSDSTASDSIRVPTESGFRMVSRRFPGPPRSAPFLGSSPEPYVPAPAIARFLTEDGYLPKISTDSLRR